MRLLSLLGAVVFTLCSGDAMAQASGEEPTPETVVISCKAEPLEEPTQGDLRDEIRAYVSALDLQSAAQIQEIESLISSERVHALRDDHHDWMRARDIYCWEVGRNSSNDLAELECLEALASTYFDQREVEITDLEARQRSVVPED